jgi:hypothetical protein
VIASERHRNGISLQAGVLPVNPAFALVPGLPRSARGAPVKLRVEHSLRNKREASL